VLVDMHVSSVYAPVVVVVVVHGWCSLKAEGPEEKGEEDGESERKHLVCEIARVD